VNGVIDVMMILKMKNVCLIGRNVKEKWGRAGYCILDVAIGKE
jgi:hypothetical protein